MPYNLDIFNKNSRKIEGKGKRNPNILQFFKNNEI